MGKSPETIATGAQLRGTPPQRAAGSAVPVTRARFWVLAVLLGLVAAAGDGLIVVVAARLRSPAAGAGPVGSARVEGSHGGPGTGTEPSTAAAPAAPDLRSSASDPGRPSRRPVDHAAGPTPHDPVQPPVAGPPDSPRPAPEPTNPQPRASMLFDEPRRQHGRAQEGAAAPPAGDARSLGRELFARTWRPDDPRCHGGDGLGPVYNATSCLDCHNQGGPGGGGPAGRDVEIVFGTGYFAAPDSPEGIHVSPFLPGPDIKIVARIPDRADLIRLHPGFRDGRSTVLHRSGVDPEYDRWRADLRARCIRVHTDAPAGPAFGRSGHRRASPEPGLFAASRLGRPVNPIPRGIPSPRTRTWISPESSA